MLSEHVDHERCWECRFGCHFDPPRWHTWADEDDIAYAHTAGQPDPRTLRCCCPCAAALPRKERRDDQEGTLDATSFPQ